jgi:hypothetical protein
MVARLDWLNNGIDRMLAGKRPLTVEEWGTQDAIRAKDVDMLMWAAEFNSIRSGAAEPDPTFLAKLRSSMLESIEAE